MCNLNLCYFSFYMELRLWKDLCSGQREMGCKGMSPLGSECEKRDFHSCSLQKGNFFPSCAAQAKRLGAVETWRCCMQIELAGLVS